MVCGMNKLFRVTLLSVTASFATLFPATSPAEILFSNLDGGTSFNKGTRFDIRGSSTGAYFGQAMPFTLSSSATLSSIDMGLVYVDTANNQITIELEGNNASNLPDGNIIASGSVAAAVAYASGTSTVLTTFTPSGEPILLSANTTYWVIALPGTTGTLDGWSTVSVSGTSAYTTDGIAFTQVSTVEKALQVNGTVVPEPGSVAFLAVAGLALFARRRRVA